MKTIKEVGQVRLWRNLMHRHGSILLGMDPEALTIEEGVAGRAAEPLDFGVWTDHCVPQDRSGWHPLVRQFYEHWLSIAPPGRLPGRQHVEPERMVPMLSRMWMLDVHRNPLRFRYRLYGTALVRSMNREVTGQWLDEAQPETALNPVLRDRFRFIVGTGRPSWRRGPSLWDRDPLHRMIENCFAPLAADGETVDKIMGLSVLFDSEGREIPG
jgi:hypothetical protein